MAVKTIRSNQVTGMERRALRELTRRCRLKHRNILPILGILKFENKDLSTVVPWMDQKLPNFLSGNPYVERLEIVSLSLLSPVYAFG